MTLLDLKKLCKDRGLKVSGKKDEVVIRLMEYDESKGVRQPMATQSFPTPIPTMTTQMPVPPQVVYGRMTSSGIVVTNNSINVSKNSGVVSGVGTVIIIYGIFRMFWALVFAAMADGGLGWALAPIAFIVAALFIFSGILMSQEYKNGIYTTMAAFLISGTLSIIFTGDELNPLSISFAEGGALIPLSMMCTLLGIGIAALPMVFSEEELKQGWPTGIERLIGKENPGKREINCPHCSNKLLVPNDYSGMISCPECGRQSTV
jgi:DNA-directed RNA polymerase subunit RPC12/RpoP